MDELSLVDRIRRLAPARGLVLGIGDDCAIYRPRTGEDLLFTTDFLIEDVHFRRDTCTPAVVGHRALARSLSDIAAMGGQPRFTLLSLALPPWAGRKWIDAFFRGFLKLAARTGTTLAGGDLSRSEKVTCDVMVCGTVARGKALRRDGARVGDLLYVSGALGKPWSKTFEPRLELGRALIGKATAAIDLSDGLSLDLRRVCLASGVAAEVDEVPVVRGATLEQALHGGEDYEVLFTLPRERRPPAGVIRIGKMARGKRGAVRFQGKPLQPLGFNHFRQFSTVSDTFDSHDRSRPHP